MVYEALDSKEIVEHPDIDGILEGLQKGDLHKVADSMGECVRGCDNTDASGDRGYQAGDAGLRSNQGQ